MAQKRSRSSGYNQSTIPLADGGLNHCSKESSSGGQASRTYGLMIVQKVEFFLRKLVVQSQLFPSSATPKTSIVSELLRFYAAVIYIYHFKRRQ